MVCLIGAHTSAAGGPHNALYEGQSIGATTIQLFTSNQKQWQGRALTEELLSQWEQALEETSIQKVMSHDSYLINLGSAKPDLLKKSRHAFEEEIKRCLQLNLSFLNFHPGAAVDSTAEECIATICESLLLYEELLADSSLTLLLETTAGQGTSVGWQFEQLGAIIDKVSKHIPIGVCIDTCHIFAAGYDIRTKEGWDTTLKQFDTAIGLDYLCAFHLNDSVKGLGSRVDRHAHLGEGEIGIDCFKVMMTHPKLRHLPKYLETPGGPSYWEGEIATLRRFAK
ncbi:MAG: deoxyribonuclease IV [Verrucomicrobia bacterium]|nr:deoxyribonuclease IV [Verrucomicrobiota bacterium]